MSKVFDIPAKDFKEIFTTVLGDYSKLNDTNKNEVMTEIVEKYFDIKLSTYDKVKRLSAYPDSAFFNLAAIEKFTAEFVSDTTLFDDENI